MLVPATCSSRWYVIHLLHREGHPDVLASLEYATHQQRRAKSNADAIPVVNDGPRAPHLTRREREVLMLLAEGLPGTAIASRLAISVTTARNHIQHLHAKLGVHSKTEAVAYAYRHNLV
ncbi:MAG: response regulator transcription factor [Pseudomonadota bacterium]|nr:MAG: response regulator transcription factor [Pseudomonadota bacterium]